MKIQLHKRHLGDSDDPEISASIVIGSWADSDHGTYCKHHFKSITYELRSDLNSWGYDILVYGEIDPGPGLTEYQLLWS